MAKPTLNPEPPTFTEGAPEFDPVAPVPSEYDGQYRKASDGLVYALCVKDDDHLGRTHKARVEKNDDHPGYFWEGTKAEFRAQFDKV